MFVRDIIKLCCTYLQLTELLPVIDNDDEVNSNMEYLHERNLLVTCANLTFDLVSSDYVPLLKTISVSTIDGKILYSSLSGYTVKDIYSIKNGFGQKVLYKCFDDFIKTVTGKVDITFSYLPPNIPYQGQCKFTNKLTPRILAYGVASEYCFIKGLYDDANIWDTRFKNALLTVCRKKGEIKIMEREWV